MVMKLQTSKQRIARNIDPEVGVLQGSVLGPTIYLFFTADLPVTDSVTVGTFADDKAILAADKTASKVSHLLQTSVDNIANWLKQWRIHVKQNRFIQLLLEDEKHAHRSLFTIPQTEVAKYLELYLDALPGRHTYFPNTRPSA